MFMKAIVTAVLLAIAPPNSAVWISGPNHPKVQEPARPALPPPDLKKLEAKRDEVAVFLKSKGLKIETSNILTSVSSPKAALVLYTTKDAVMSILYLWGLDGTADWTEYDGFQGKR